MAVSMDDWLAEVVTELGLDVGVLDEQAVLDLARDAAHHITRPAAPLTAFLVGYAAGVGAAGAVESRALADRVGALARRHDAQA